MLHISSQIQGEPCRKRPHHHSILSEQYCKQMLHKDAGVITKSDPSGTHPNIRDPCGNHPGTAYPKHTTGREAMLPKTHQAPTKALCIRPLFVAFLTQSCRRTSAWFCKPLEEPTQTCKKGQPRPTTAQTASTSIRCRRNAKVKTSQAPPCQRIVARRVCRNPRTIHHRDTLPTTSAHTNHLGPPRC